MKVAGWEDIAYDDLAVISGASALFAYQNGEFMPKYAHLYFDMDEKWLLEVEYGSLT